MNANYKIIRLQYHVVVVREVRQQTPVFSVFWALDEDWGTLKRFKTQTDYECTNSYVYKRDSVIEEAMQRVVILILIVIPRDSVLTQEN